MLNICSEYKVSYYLFWTFIRYSHINLCCDIIYENILDRCLVGKFSFTSITTFIHPWVFLIAKASFHYSFLCSNKKPKWLSRGGYHNWQQIANITSFWAVHILSVKIFTPQKSLGQFNNFKKWLRKNTPNKVFILLPVQLLLQSFPLISHRYILQEMSCFERASSRRRS